MFQERFKGISRKFRVFQGSLKGVSRKFQGCFKEVLVNLGSFKNVSGKFQGSFKGVSRKFQGCLRKF